ncbi:MAG: DUF7948 domain-containing protein [Usitatibacter sp.]
MKSSTQAHLSRPVPRKLAVLVAAAFMAHAADAVSSPASEGALRIPISFERNDGQFRPEVLFVARGASADIAVRSGEIQILPQRRMQRDGRKVVSLPADSPGLRLTFNGANRSPEVEPGTSLAGRSHYYHGKSATENVPHFDRVTLKDVYPSIDVALHGAQGALEYDFEVAPGADPRDIRLNLASAQKVSLDEQGGLLMQVGGETLRQHPPVAYQQGAGERVAVPARFELRHTDAGVEAGFVVGEYDRARPLVIDPLLAYSTYLGGTGDDFGGYMAVDPSGDVYIAYTSQPNGTNFMSTTADVTVTKLSQFGSFLVYSTTISGSSYDIVQAIALGASGSGVAAYVTGYTASTDYPSCNGCPAPGGLEDAFFSALAPDGTLFYSRLIGGPGNEAGASIATDASRNVYIAGDTDDTFPTTPDALFPNRLGTPGTGDFADAFLYKFSMNTLSPVYSTLLGGSGTDVGKGVAFDSAGNMYVVGTTTSRLFPTVNAIQPSYPSTGTFQGAFATKFAADGQSLLYSTFIGGSADNAVAIAMTPGDEAVILGDSPSFVFGPATPVRPWAGGRDVFVARLSADGSTMPFASFLGGSGSETAGGLAVDGSGNIYVTGQTLSADFPLLSPLPSGSRGPSSAFLTRFNSGAIDFSTYLGGSGGEIGFSVALGSSGTYVSGRTTSSDFPTVNAFRNSRSGNSDVFVSRIRFGASLASRGFDFNADGKNDIVWRNTADGSILQWLMSGTTLVQQTSLGAPGTTDQPKHIADFNGDRKADMIWEDVDGTTSMTLFNGAAVTFDGVLVGPGTGWSVSHVGDFNGDGKADLVWTHTDGSVQAWLMSGPNAAQVASFVPAGSGWSVLKLADLNGDGKADILWQHTDGTVLAWIMDGLAVKQAGSFVGAGTGWTVALAGDFDGDGRADLLWQNTNGAAQAWLMNGLVATQIASVVPAGTGYVATHTGDLNGDGKSDLLWRHTDGTVIAWLMGPALTVTQVASFTPSGTPYSLTHMRDLDGNGTADLLWRHTDGSVQAWLMNGLTPTSIAQFTGPGSYVIVPPSP